MKKIFALVLALCLLYAASASLAETAEATRLELDGFTLELSSGEYYQQYEKSANSPTVIIYPFYSNGDQSTNYNFVWGGGPFEMNLDQVKDQLAQTEETMRAALTSNGIELTSFEMGEPWEAELNGKECIAVEYNLRMSAMGMELTSYMRQILIGSIGYVITLTASSPEDLETITEMMAQSLTI